MTATKSVCFTWKLAQPGESNGKEIISASICIATGLPVAQPFVGGLLKRATPFIHWPQGLEPRNVDVFAMGGRR